MIRITVWNEFAHEQEDPDIRKLYPEGIHGAIADFLKKSGEDFKVRTATLYDEECAAAEHGTGTGTAMKMLTAMLKEFEPADSPLFARAKGCNPSGCEIRPLERYSLEDCMETASETGMTSYLFTLMVCASRLCGEDALLRLQGRFGRRS